MDDTTGKPYYIGFCIDVFEKVVSHFPFPERFDYEFYRHNGTYEDLVNKVRDKTYDAAVGDITILANRSQYVEFTQPFIASDLTMIVPAKPDRDRALIFMEPFTPTMWIASGGILVYTMLEAIVGISNTSSYGDEFRRGNITALFLEYPIERAFFTEYCYGYVAIQENYRFGGFGFVFPKGSRLAANFSEAILELSESGEMKRLENKWFSPECTMRNFTNETPQLGLNSFWALYALTITTSTGCFLFACLCTRRNRQDHEQGSNSDNLSVTEMSIL
ncbi:hypothetical protein NL676_008263 [Syzygium grande]|nr:hypothetical protein NL676_008263 [Syzygium grande]